MDCHCAKSVIHKVSHQLAFVVGFVLGAEEETLHTLLNVHVTSITGQKLHIND